MSDFFELKGQIITDIKIGDETIIATTQNKYIISHHQDCCEFVRLNNTIGEVSNIIGSPIILAEEDNSDPSWDVARYSDDSHTWSAYFLETAKGRLELWFLGESNGYYCETMSFEKYNT